MKKISLALVLLLLLPFCTVGDEPTSSESVVEDSIDEEPTDDR